MMYLHISNVFLLHWCTYSFLIQMRILVLHNYAKARLQKAARWLRYFATDAIGIFTLIVEGFFSFLTARSLKRDLQDNFINHEDFKRKIKHAILFVFRVISTSLIIAFLIFNAKKQFFHPITAFLYGFIGNIASRVIVPGTMEVFCILYCNPQNDHNQ